MKKRTEVSVIVSVVLLLAVMSSFTPVCADLIEGTISIGEITLAPQTSATIPITITEANHIFCGADINLTYDKTVVQVTDVANGGYFDNVTYTIDNIVTGKVRMCAWGDDNFNAPTTVAFVTLKAIGNPGECSPLILDGHLKMGTGSTFHNTFFNNGSVCIIAGVPVYNTTGMVALVGLCALVLVVTVRRRR
jgi:hypothetical protein